MRVVGRDEMPDTTLLIQGPLMEDTYKFYYRFYPEVPKVFSTWEGNRRGKGWYGKANLHSDGDIFLENKRPERFGIYSKDVELFVAGTLAGLGAVRTKYCIYLRGDEWYSNLDVFEKELNKKPEVIQSVSVFFKKWAACPFHPSEHVVAGKTELLRIMFGSSMINMVTKKKISPSDRPLPRISIVCKSYMDAMLGESSDWKGDFKHMFAIMQLERLKYYKVTSEESGRVWYSNFDDPFDPKRDGTWERSISSMEEL